MEDAAEDKAEDAVEDKAEAEGVAWVARKLPDRAETACAPVADTGCLTRWDSPATK